MFEDANVIFSYTRAQFIKDGGLIDVTDTAKLMGFTVPVGITATCYGECVKHPENSEGPDESSRLVDLLQTCYQAIRNAKPGDGSIVWPEATIRKTGTPATIVPLRVEAGPGDEGELVLTVMLSHED